MHWSCGACVYPSSLFSALQPARSSDQESCDSRAEVVLPLRGSQSKLRKETQSEGKDRSGVSLHQPCRRYLREAGIETITGEALGEVRQQDRGRNYRVCYRFGAELTLNSDVITKHMLRKGVN